MNLFKRDAGTTVPVKRNKNTMATFQNEMNNLMDRFWDRSLLGTRAFPSSLEFDMDFCPRVDTSETDQEYHVEAELPGINEDDIELSLENNTLTLKGEKREEKHEENENYYHTERNYGSFYRAIPLPSEIDEEKVNARFKDGVLTVNLAKSEKALKSRRKIDIKKAA